MTDTMGDTLGAPNARLIRPYSASLAALDGQLGVYWRINAYAGTHIFSYFLHV